MIRLKGADGAPSSGTFGIDPSMMTGAVAITIANASTHIWRSEFLAAIESELGVKFVPTDAIVILRGDLPEVTEDCYVEGGGGVKVMRFKSGGHPGYGDGEGGANCRSQARSFLALAEYLDAHLPVPPVDDEMVAALTAALIAAEEPDFQTDLAYARRLYRAGVRIEVTA